MTNRFSEDCEDMKFENLLCINENLAVNCKKHIEYRQIENDEKKLNY
jgi:hypothetical protein